ncbi:uncharacterized protein si:dkey-112e17.1 [Pimephales promelas]|uniref:uncharacterized protein si:dkey-112e17.1 n=1 Tax=Pimephales promelas TaxID=90988 RepID=UPI0019555A88|nr:uncharacterized protein si:dkey-112e17.1 [Pimephales promelas]KAG1958090.1 hypothetical protein F2P79_006472 [Pimephales promelas]
MGLRGLTRTGAYMTVCLLWVTGCFTQKVYFDCGAKVDVVDVQGLILSPGFPFNYSSGTHCVWQFFVPVGHQLIMEMFDFDVFESHNSPAIYTSTAVDEAPNDSSALVSKSLGSPKEPQSTHREEVKQVVIQEQSTKMEMTKVSNSAKLLSDSPSALQPSLPLSGEQPVEDRNSISPQASRAVSDWISTSPHTATDETDQAVSPDTQPPLIDACPHDVLYISDLITFSSRFCGSRRPSSSQLVFGSDDDMVEVIMELITTTHWGRGFALLFHYQNITQAFTTKQQRSVLSSDSRTGALLGAVSGTVVFALALAGILCVIFRPKLCAKGANASSSTSSEAPEGVLNSAADVSELQMVSPNDLERQLGTGNDNHSLNRSLSHTACDVSEKSDLQLFSSGLAELELGTDEVFVIASAPTSAQLPFSPHTQRERFLRHSDTGPSRPFDWSTPNPALPTVIKSSQTRSTISTRPRAWSVRTFQDLLPPLPQLHKKWCSWNANSPFTKLVDSGLPSTTTDAGRGKVLSDAPLHSSANCCQSDSFTSNASYPLTQPNQRQRRLNSTSNLRRTRFNTPCFGLLSGTSESSKPQANGITTSNTLSDTSQQQHHQAEASSVEDDHVAVPVFAISEEEDRQPLVSAEPPEKPLRMNGQMFEGTNMPLLSKSQDASIHPTSLGRGGGGTLETQDPSALSC